MSTELLSALDQAIRAEVEGHHFYRMAAATTDDPRGRAVFEALAREEQLHAEWLRAQYRSVQETGGFDLDLDLGEPLVEPGSPIFSDQLKARAATAHYEVTALSVGVQLEENGQRHYQEMAKAAADPKVKALFTELAEWESGHYHALLHQLDTLKEAYWAANQFAPF